MIHKIILALLFPATVLADSPVTIEFSSSPRGVLAYVGQSARLEWTLTRRPSAGWRVDFYYMSPEPRAVCGLTVSPTMRLTPRYGHHYSRQKVSLRASRYSNEIGFVIADLHPDDAQQSYMIRVEQESGTWITDSHAWIVLYGFLLNPKLVKSSPEPGVFIYKCSVVSTTVMPANIPDEYKPTIQYHWLVDNMPVGYSSEYQVSGPGNDQLTILHATGRYDNKNYTCVAKEAGSWYSSTVTDVFSIDYFPHDTHISPGGTVLVNEHDDVLLKCQSTCRPSCRYTWRKDGNPVGAGDTLHLRSITGDQPSRYTCEASNEVSFDSHDVVVLVNHPPRMSVEDHMEGEYRIITCTVKSTTHLTTFTWINMTEPGHQSIGCNYRDETTCILKVPVSNLDRPTTYQCLADNKARGSPVSMKRTFSGRGPRVEPPNGIREVRMGESTSFTVWVNADPAPTREQWYLQYYRFDRPNFEADPASNVHVFVGSSTATLRVISVDNRNYGIYRMWWLGSDGRGRRNDEALFRLVPKDPPNLSVFEFAHRDKMVGSDVKLDCTVSNEPTPFNMTWINKTTDDHRVIGCHFRNSTHCSITLRGLQLHHSGIYECMADNGALHVTAVSIALNVNGPVNLIKVSPANRYCYVRYGDSTSIKVWVKGNPLPRADQWHWTFTGSRLSEAGAGRPDGVHVTVTGNLFTLSISHVTDKHYGIYGVVARNSYGGWNDTALRFHVIPRDPPQLTIAEVPCTDLMEGSELTLTCIAANKPSPYLFTWVNLTAVGQPALGCTHKNETHCSLVLSDVDILDSGTFQCMADNGASQTPVTATQTLAVFGPPRWYKIDPVDRTLRVGIGEDAVFKVWIIAHPMPRRDQWHWHFSSSVARSTQPDNVYLTLSGNMVTLTVEYVNDHNYGVYNLWAENKYGGWDELDLMFRLLPKAYK